MNALRIAAALRGLSNLVFSTAFFVVSFALFLAWPMPHAAAGEGGILGEIVDARAVVCIEEPAPRARRLADVPFASIDNDAQIVSLPLVSDSGAVAPILPAYLVFGPYKVPSRVADAIARAAHLLDVDVAYMMAVAHRESLFDPNAQAPTSSASGLFQFIESTWFATLKAFGPAHGFQAEADAIVRVRDRLTVVDPAERERILDMRFDPYLASLMAAELARSDASRVASRIGRPLRTSEMYIAHFLGADGATRLIRAADRRPRVSAARMFPRAARANRSVFYTGRGRHRRALSAHEIHRNLTVSIDRRMAHFSEIGNIDFALNVLGNDVYVSLIER